MARLPTTTRLRKRKEVVYNVQKLSDLSVQVKEPAAPKKAASTKQPKKKVGKKKGAVKSSATYFTLVQRALRDEPHPGLGLESIINFLSVNYDKSNRRYVRLALADGVEEGVLVKTKGSYRLSKKAQEKTRRKKKKRSTKRTTTTTKKTTKKTAKKATTKKASAKKATTKNTAKEKDTVKPSTPKKNKRASSSKEGTPVKSPKKKVIGPSSDETVSVTEAAGAWQYYDGGWCNYEVTASNIVEGVYQEFLTAPDIHVRPVKSGHFSYEVNFSSFEQTNTETGTMRKIRRV